MKERGEFFKKVCKFTIKGNFTNPAADVIIDIILKNIVLSLAIAISYAVKRINHIVKKRFKPFQPPTTKKKSLIEIRNLLKE
ncbi:hypothetical protein [Photorhabdus sp. SF281]|uniref:hypothetical protein n=1 Tax=Photorhabdus sp. SF281 TaxID=3459527 RepID=UPI0040441662